MKGRSPHILAVDDGAFEKGRSTSTPIVAVMTEGASLVESAAITSFPIDGDGVTNFLVDWLSGLRMTAASQVIVFRGITIARLASLDGIQM